MVHLEEGEEAPKWWEQFVTLQPSLVRGFIVTLVGMIGAVTGVVIDDKQTSLIINFVLALLGLLTAILIKPAVTPNAKVVVRDDTPLATVSTLVPGDATPTGVTDGEILSTAKEAA